MASFSKPARQAAAVMKRIQGVHIKSVGTVRNYEQALTRVAEFLRANRLCALRELSSELAVRYLETRGQSVGQKTLDMERQAIQAMMRFVTGQLGEGERLPVVASEHAHTLRSRAYSRVQVGMVVEAQRDGNALATEVAYAAGLRAHELLTLLPIADQPADRRPARDSKFLGREGCRYSVIGKGGLIREVVIPYPLAEQLERLRLDKPKRYTDRGIHYRCHYALSGGHRWSNSFSRAAKRALGWSAGAHGVRHSYAQERMVELQVKFRLDRKAALETVSQEMGHFRPEITEVYLR